MSEGASVIIVGTKGEEEAILRRQIDDIAQVVATSEDPERGISLVKEHWPTIALLFLDHEPAGILQLTSQISALNGCVPMIVSRDRDPDKILLAMRSGAKEFAYLDQGSDDVRRAVLELSYRPEVQRGGGEVTAQGSIITVFSCKGGSGATMLATNVAGALARARSNKHVVLVDLDLMMGDVLVFLDSVSKYTIRDLVDNIHRLDADLLYTSLTKHPAGMNILAQSDAVDEVDVLDSETITKALGFLQRHFDYVIVDGLRDFGELSLTALDLTDKVLLTVTQDIPSLKNAKRCLDIFRRLGYENDKLKLVLNRYHKRGRLDADSIADALGLPVQGMVANDFPTVIKAVNEGALLIDAAPRARVTKDIQDLVDLVAAEDEDDADRPKKRGLFGLRK